MRSGAGPEALSFLVEQDAYIPPTRTYGAQVSLLTCRVEKFSEILHDPELRVRLPVILCLYVPLYLAWTAATASIQIPPPVLIGCQKLHPDEGGCNTPAAGYLQNLKVLPSTRCPSMSCFAGAGILAPNCGYC